MLGPFFQNGLTGLIAHIPHEIVDQAYLVDLASAPGLGELAVEGRKVAGSALYGFALFKQQYACTEFCGLAYGRYPGKPPPTTITSSFQSGRYGRVWNFGFLSSQGSVL